jgi:hypothetical protein
MSYQSPSLIGRPGPEGDTGTASDYAISAADDVIASKDAFIWRALRFHLASIMRTISGELIFRCRSK